MDKKLFSKRLAELRKNAGFKNQYQFAKAYEELFPTERRDEAGGNEGDFGGIYGTVKNYENKNHNGDPGLTKVANMCDMLGCDIDYLAGRIDKQTHDLQFVCDYTKLSGEAIENIRSLKPGDYYYRNMVISRFFEKDEVSRRFFRDLQAVWNIYKAVNAELNSYDDEIKEAVEDVEDEKALSNLEQLLFGNYPNSPNSLSNLRREFDGALYTFSITCGDILLEEREALYKRLSTWEQTIQKRMEAYKHKEGDDGEGHAQG